jgi:hypothetical protein
VGEADLTGLAPIVLLADGPQRSIRLLKYSPNADLPRGFPGPAGPEIHAKLIAAVGESLSERLRRANAVILSLTC